MRPQIRAIRRDEFVREYLRALISDGGFSLNTGTAIYRAIYASSPIELCQLGRALDSGLVMGVAPYSLFEKLQALGLPEDFTGYRFGSSWVLRDACPDQIRWLRQLLLFSKKFPDAPMESESVTLSDFAKRIHASGRPREVLNCDRELAARLLGDCPAIDSFIRVKHGPGAVRDGERGREKWNWTASTPYDSNFFVNDLHELDCHRPSLPKLAQTCRAVTVPKDFRRSRVIAIEAKEAMFVSQGLKALLYERLAHASSRQIEFENQEAHRELLKDPDYASLDLSDASDMVSYKLCSRLLPRQWFNLVNSFRSRLVLINGVPVRSRAMFTMGNALCFPIEALVHYIAVRRVVPPHYRVSVYGDDLIVPRKYAIWVMETLKDFGLKPSPSKSCYRTSFKESCGLDLFKGRNITPAYLRLEPAGIQSGVQALQLVSFQRHHWENGFVNSSRMVSEAITHFCDYPATPFPHPWKLGGNARKCRSRWNTLLQRVEYRIPTLITHKSYQLSGWNALRMWFASGSIEMFEKRDVPRLRYAWVADTCSLLENPTTSSWKLPPQEMRI